MNRGDHPQNYELSIEVATLRVERDAARELAEERNGLVKDLRDRLGVSEEERRAAQVKVTALLTDQRERPETKQTRPVFWWLLGLAILAAIVLTIVASRPELLAGLSAG